MLLFELWIRYYIFIRRLYKNVDRHENMDITIASLASLCLLIILFFFATLFSYIYNYQGITNIFSKGLPLSVIGGLGFGILALVIYYAFERISKETKIKVFRRCLKNNSSRNILYPILYIVLTSLMFIAAFVLIIMNIP